MLLIVNQAKLEHLRMSWKFDTNVIQCNAVHHTCKR